MKPFLSILAIEPTEGLSDIITEIPLDAHISSTHNYSSDITEFPVESGAAITDHVHLKPVALTIEGFTSDSPVTSIPVANPKLKGDASIRTTPSQVSRAKSAFDVLLQLRNSRIPLTVVTRFDVYEDMMISSLEIPQSRDRGSGLWFSMQLKKITTAKTLVAALPPDVVAALKKRRGKTKKSGTSKKLADQLSGKADKGLQQTKDASGQNFEKWKTNKASGWSEWKSEKL